MKTLNLWSIVAFLGLCLGAASGEAQSARDAEVLVPLAHGVVGVPAASDAASEGLVIEELPAVVAPRWSAEDDALAPPSATRKTYWLGFFSLCMGTAGVLTLRRRTRPPEARLSLPKATGEGRISLV
jgi:hypothetical protein